MIQTCFLAGLFYWEGKNNSKIQTDTLYGGGFQV